MIQVGTRVKWTHDGIEGTVTDLCPSMFGVKWDKYPERSDSYYEYADLFPRPESKAVIEVTSNAPVKPEPITPHQFDLIMVMSRNTGRMEATLEILWRRIREAIEYMPIDGASAAMTRLGLALDSITRCAEGIEDLPKADGSVQVSHLRTYIANNK